MKSPPQQYRRLNDSSALSHAVVSGEKERRRDILVIHSSPLGISLIFRRPRFKESSASGGLKGVRRGGLQLLMRRGPTSLPAPFAGFLTGNGYCFEVATFDLAGAAFPSPRQQSRVDKQPRLEALSHSHLSPRSIYRTSCTLRARRFAIFKVKGRNLY